MTPTFSLTKVHDGHSRLISLMNYDREDILLWLLLTCVDCSEVSFTMVDLFALKPFNLMGDFLRYMYSLLL